jgi:glycosyltransferase involved in cell wall biosynthesis
VRVALDAQPLLDPQTGVGRYVRELGSALELLGADVTRYAVALSGSNEDIDVRWRLPLRVVQRVWATAGRFAIDRLVGDVDVVHATNFVLPMLDRIPGVVTVHDLSFLRDDTFPGGKRLRELVPWSVQRAAGVIVPTQAIAREVTDSLHVPTSKISVTHEGVAPVFFGATPLSDEALARLGVGRPFALGVGTIEPRKNLVRLLQAWEQVRADLDDWSLVLAGPQGWGPELPETPGVVLLGWVGDATLPGLLAAADLFCYPSEYEGFGLPPLEAMAAGTPTIAGSYSAAAEVLGDAAVLVEPSDVTALAGAIRRLGGDADLRRSLVVQGRARAASFTWEATAKATIDAYRATSRRVAEGSKDT